jgi:hypothetical protein
MVERFDEGRRLDNVRTRVCTFVCDCSVCAYRLVLSVRLVCLHANLTFSTTDRGQLGSARDGLRTALCAITVIVLVFAHARAAPVGSGMSGWHAEIRRVERERVVDTRRAVRPARAVRHEIRLRCVRVCVCVCARACVLTRVQAYCTVSRLHPRRTYRHRRTRARDGACAVRAERPTLCWCLRCSNTRPGACVRSDVVMCCL